MLMAQRLGCWAVLAGAAAALLWQWHAAVGFDPVEAAHWRWLAEVVHETGALPRKLWPGLGWSIGGLFAGIALVGWWTARPGNRTVQGVGGAAAHGTAAFARWRDVVKAGLAGRAGVTVGGWRRGLGIRRLTHDGPEHVLCFAPTRSGKGVGLVLPTLLTWPESVLVLDIKGENFARSAGYRASAGQRVIRFDPVAATGSARYNPLAEVRLGSGREIADCQNAAVMIVDPEGKGLRDFWMQSAFEWLSGVLLHVLYRARRTDDRTATLADVHAFMSVGAVGEAGASPAADAEEAFTRLLADMAAFEHGRAAVDAEVRRAAGQMQKRAPNERSGVHSSASVPLALYADPIVAANTAGSDFRIDALVGGDKPTSLYLVIPPPRYRAASTAYSAARQSVLDAPHRRGWLRGQHEAVSPPAAADAR